MFNKDGFYNYNDYPEFEGSGHLTAVEGSRYLTMYDITRYRLLCSQLLVSFWKKRVYYIKKGLEVIMIIKDDMFIIIIITLTKAPVVWQP